MNLIRKWGRFIEAVGKRFNADRGFMWASGLAYATLLSMVPLLAVMFAVLKGLGVQRRLEPLLLSRLSLSAEAVSTIIGYIDQTKVATIGTLGAAALLITVITVLSSVESSFNHIWRVARNRTVWRQLTDYLSVVLLTPFLLLAAVTLTSSLQLQRVLAWLTGTYFIGNALLQALSLVPIVINAVALGILYAVMPNRRPNIAAVVLSAAIAGAAWHVVQWVYVTMQIGVANYSAIYGALSQVPVTLVWLYVSWVVVLAGAEIAAVYEFGTETTSPQPLHEAAIALHVLLNGIDAFYSGGEALDPVRIAQQLRIPPDGVMRVCEKMRSWHWLTSVDDEAARYVLACDPHGFDLSRLADLEIGAIPTGCSPEARRLLESVSHLTRQSWKEVKLPSRQAAHPPSVGAPTPV